MSTASYNALTWACAGLAALLGLLGYGLATKRNQPKPGCLCLVLCGLCIFGAIKLDGARLSLVRQNVDAVQQSAYLQGVMRNVDVRHNASKPHYTISFTPDDRLRAQEPYLTLRLTEDEETDQLAFASVIQCSLGDVVTEEMIESCKTICLCISDTWATARYTGTTSGTGTTERIQCYLYDVQEQKVFAMEEFKAKELPDTASKIPHYYVDTVSIEGFIKAHIE